MEKPYGAIPNIWLICYAAKWGKWFQWCRYLVPEEPEFNRIIFRELFAGSRGKWLGSARDTGWACLNQRYVGRIQPPSSIFVNVTGCYLNFAPEQHLWFNLSRKALLGFACSRKFLQCRHGPPIGSVKGRLLRQDLNWAPSTLRERRQGSLCWRGGEETYAGNFDLYRGAPFNYPLSFAFLPIISAPLKETFIG